MAADEQRIHRAYERGRLVRAAGAALPVALVALVALTLSTRPLWTSSCGVALVAVSLLFFWRGQALGRAVVPGVLAGLVPMALAFGTMRFGHVCTSGGCVSLCVPVCSVGALLAGLWLARVSRAKEHPRRGLAAGVAIALLTGALGCVAVGSGALVGLVLGIAVTATPVMLARRTGA